MEIFFKRNAKVLTSNFNNLDDENLKEWLPGDVVFFDMNNDGLTDSVGIITDSTTRDGTLK